MFVSREPRFPHFIRLANCDRVNRYSCTPSVGSGIIRRREIIMSDEKKYVSNTTHIQSVSGEQVNVGAGSGDINAQYTAPSQINTKEQFLDALREFKRELDAARAQGLPQDAADIAITQVQAAEQAAREDSPRATEVRSSLEKAKEALVLVSASAATTGAVVTAADKLVDFAQKLLKVIEHLF